MQLFLEEQDYEFLPTPPNYLKLHGIAMCYNDGIHTKIVPFNILRCIPVVHDKLHDSNINISLVMCPYTLVSCLYEGKYKMLNKKYKECSVITDETGFREFAIFEQPKNINKHEVYFKTLRNIFRDHVHAKYLHIINKDIVLKNVVPDAKYYINNNIFFDIKQEQFHPKTLVYVINYTGNINKSKNTILVGSDAIMNKPTGYNIHESHIAEYLADVNIKNNKLKRNGFIMPMLWCIARFILFPNAKVVFINA